MAKHSGDVERIMIDKTLVGRIQGTADHGKSAISKGNPQEKPLPSFFHISVLQVLKSLEGKPGHEAKSDIVLLFIVLASTDIHVYVLY